MDLILYTSNAVLPVFFVIFVGIGLNKLGFFSETTKNELVKLVFYVGTPCLLFSNISGSDLSKTMNPHFLGFTVLAILAFLLLCILLTFFIKDSKKKGAVIQIGYRSNFAIAGMPIAVNLMDEAGVALTAVTLSFVVIVFNVSAVALLSYYGDGKKSPKAVLSGIIKNPLILGTLAGLFFAVFHIPVPTMLEKTIGILGDIASCIGLIVIGAEISLRGFQRDKAYILFSVFLRNILSPIFT
ncbi:MAG: AEC family transporter [Clostridia bacterium]|nr:AEC family transporter [Clostridia bacterium]